MDSVGGRRCSVALCGVSSSLHGEKRIPFNSGSFKGIVVVHWLITGIKKIFTSSGIRGKSLLWDESIDASSVGFF